MRMLILLHCTFYVLFLETLNYPTLEIFLEKSTACILTKQGVI